MITKIKTLDEMLYAYEEGFKIWQRNNIVWKNKKTGKPNWLSCHSSSGTILEGTGVWFNMKVDFNMYTTYKVGK